MDNSVKNNKNGNVKWITALCLTAVLAIIGWTTTINLAARMKVLEDIKTQQVLLGADIAANNVRISILETRWITIQSEFENIRLLLQKLRDDK